jgi:hypothetical protein
MLLAAWVYGSIFPGKRILRSRESAPRTRQISLPLLASAAISFFGMFLFLRHNGYANGFALSGGALWLAAFYFGATYRYWLHAFLPPSPASSSMDRRRDWHTGQFTAGCLLALSALIFRIDYAALLPATLFLSYAAAKTECVAAGCCGSRYSDRGLQRAEAVCSGLLALGVLVLPEARWIGAAAVAVFALMRCLSCVVQNGKDKNWALFLRKLMADGLLFLVICRLGTLSV